VNPLRAAENPLSIHQHAMSGNPSISCRHAEVLRWTWYGAVAEFGLRSSFASGSSSPGESWANMMSASTIAQPSNSYQSDLVHW
jgi:hypothetical protein